jgi:broad specificity phosphatase PhoE
MARLLLVRHGETALNSSQKFWGKTDVELGLAGIRQAELLRDRLAGVKIDFAYSSELKRAVVTAQTVLGSRKLELERCPYLNEISFGDAEGLDFKEISLKYPDLIQAWTQHDRGLQYPGGESLYQMEARTREFKKLLSKHSESETILIVAHSGVLRILICQLLGLDLIHFWNFGIDLASLSVIDMYSENAILNLCNDVSHLSKGAC